MKKIRLFNRDGASLNLVKTNININPGVYVWSLEVDSDHDYILEHCRFIYSGDPNSNTDIEAIDPSGGPMLSLADEFEGKYKIVKIYNAKNIWISERDNNI